MIPASRLAWSRLDSYRGPRPDPSQRLISVTSLINAPRIVRLTALHRDALPIAEPGTDTWALLGTAVHAALEASAACPDVPPPIHRELRCETTVTVDGVQWTISGQDDVLEADGTLWDYKVTSSYSVADGRKATGDWASQLNVLRWLLERSGAVPRGTVRSLAVWAILRDWSATQAARDESYPQGQEVGIPLPLWSDESVQSYVEGRIRLHEAARHSLPLCTPEERWARDAGFAVMKTKTSTRATAVLQTREAAERYLAEVLDGKGIIEERPGKSVRCARFCRVSNFCDQFKSTLDRA